MECMPRMADCGGLMMGVDSSEPYTPPLLMVKVPPAMSSMLIVPSRAFLPSAFIVCGSTRICHVSHQHPVSGCSARHAPSLHCNTHAS